MRLQKQGYNECQLATIAMLADVPLDAVRRVALRGAGVDDWYRAVGTSGFYSGVDAATRRFLPTFPAFGQLWHPDAASPTSTPPVFRPTPGERGELVLRFPNSCHAVAYECDRAGKITIYDPGLTHPMLWEEYRRYQMGILVAVWPIARPSIARRLWNWFTARI